MDAKLQTFCHFDKLLYFCIVKNAIEKPSYIAFAPLQGYTDAIYRIAHHECAGGVDEYYTPFVRIEKGEIRRKELRDINPERNANVPTVPQVIARDRDEFARLCDTLQQQGWSRIDLNMGCPFPMQVKAGRGCGLLQHPDRVEGIAQDMQNRHDVTFSVKTRLGQDSADELLELMPIINSIPLLHVTLHPRIGRQQYKGSVDLESFLRVFEICKQEIVYNGDISSIADGRLTISNCSSMIDTSKLKGIMIGRGLLAKPWLLSDKEPMKVLHDMHSIVYRHAEENLCGDNQILARLHAFWEYIDIDRKQKKAILKSNTIPRYREAIHFIYNK